MKPIPFKIPKTQDSSFHVQVDEAEDFYDRLHEHPEWQITAIHKGEGVLFAGNSTSPFQAGDVFILGSDMPHLLKNDPNSLPGTTKGVCSTSLFFHIHSFGKDFFELPELQQVKAFLKQSQRGIIFTGPNKVQVHKKISRCIELKGLSLFVELLSILEWMLKHKAFRFINPETYFPLHDEKNENRINQIINHSIQHLQTEISLTEIAKVANLSVSQFCRYFKLHTQKTYIQFLNELRIETACSHLQKYDHTVERIAYDVGFQNLSHFNRQFKKVKRMTPSLYRKTFLG